MNKFFSNTQKITSAKLKRLLKQLFPPGGDDKSVKLGAIQKTNILCSIWEISSKAKIHHKFIKCFAKYSKRKTNVPHISTIWKIKEDQKLQHVIPTQVMKYFAKH